MLLGDLKAKIACIWTFSVHVQVVKSLIHKNSQEIIMH